MLFALQAVSETRRESYWLEGALGGGYCKEALGSCGVHSNTSGFVGS